MDNASCHCSEEILRKLAENNIWVITYPSHTSHIFQALDLSFFGVFLKNKSMENQKYHFCQITKTILNILQAYEKTATSLNIRGSFGASGIKIVSSNFPKRVEIDENSIRENAHFKELWNLNVPVEVLSSRRRNQEFGLINQRFLGQN